MSKVIDASQVDNRPGAYYVTARDGDRHWLLSGPYIDDHGGALAVVDDARQIAQDSNPRAWFYSYGTARMETPEKIGSLQRTGTWPLPRSAIAAGITLDGGAA